MSYVQFETRKNSKNKKNRYLYLISLKTGEIRTFCCNKKNIDKKLRYHKKALLQYVSNGFEIDCPWGTKENEDMSFEEYEFYKKKIKEFMK